MFNFIEWFIGTVKTISIIDIADILMVAYLIYQAIKLVRDTRAVQLVKGLGALIMLNLFASTLRLQTMTFIMKNVLQIGALALLVVFQPELRRALEQVGRTNLYNLGLFSTATSDDDATRWKAAIEAIGAAFASLSLQKIGALVVIERESILGEIIKTGTVIDCIPSAEMIGNVFFPNSPLHDGAMIVRNAKLYAAGCFLPLSDNYEIGKELGTRHRAALGMSENSDAVVLVVSEETGMISMAVNGKLKRGYTSTQLMQDLTSLLIVEKDETQTKRQMFMKVKR